MFAADRLRRYFRCDEEPENQRSHQWDKKPGQRPVVPPFLHAFGEEALRIGVTVEHNVVSRLVHTPQIVPLSNVVFRSAKVTTSGAAMSSWRRRDISPLIPLASSTIPIAATLTGSKNHSKWALLVGTVLKLPLARSG